MEPNKNCFDSKKDEEKKRKSKKWLLHASAGLFAYAVGLLLNSPNRGYCWTAPTLSTGVPSKKISFMQYILFLEIELSLLENNKIWFQKKLQSNSIALWTDLGRYCHTLERVESWGLTWHTHVLLYYKTVLQIKNLKLSKQELKNFICSRAAPKLHVVWWLHCTSSDVVCTEKIKRW